MSKVTKLDESKPFAKCLGSPDVGYSQGGYDFDHGKNLIAGSGRGNSPETVDAIEAIAAQIAKPVYSDMHIHALKKHASLKYAELEAADEDFEPVEPGKGMQDRLVTFLNEH
jgi:hypothetical protein